jgi:lipoprotein-releasing system permease protein
MIPDRLSRTVAWRALTHSRRLTLLTVGVVAVSVVLVVFLTALIDGLQVKLVSDVTGAIPHVTITPREREPTAVWEADGSRDSSTVYVGERVSYSQQKKKIDDWPRWVRRLRDFDSSITAVAPSAEDQGFVLRGRDKEAVRIYGTDLRAFDRIVPIEQKLIQGRFERLNAGEIAIGYQLAEELGVEVGDRLQVAPPEGRSQSKTIAGVFATGFGSIDKSTVFMTLRDGQSLFGLGDGVTSIGIKLTDPFQADPRAAQLRRLVPHEVTPWTENNQQLLSGLRGQAQSSQLIVAFTTIAAGFAIASILIVLVTSKLSEIGVLKAMGATRKQMRTVFALQGTLLAFLGSVVGVALGVALVLWLSSVPGEPNALGQTEPIFPFNLTWGVIVGPIVIASVVGFVASLIPARRAARVSPIEVIRGG